MRASNYTPVDAVKKLHEELDKLFAGKTFSGQGKNKPLNIFDFEFPTDFGNDEDVDTVAAAAPFILVKAAGWSIDKMEEPEMVDMSLCFNVNSAKMKRIKQEQHIEIEEKSQQLKFRIFVVSTFT